MNLRGFVCLSIVAATTGFGMSTATALDLAVNFVNSLDDTFQDQDGFTELAVVNNAANGTGAEVLAGTVDGVDVILQNVSGGGTLDRIRSVDRGDDRIYNGVLSNLSVGWVGNEEQSDQFLVKLRGVGAGRYLWTSYHVDNGNVHATIVGGSSGNQSGKMSIELSVDGGATYTMLNPAYQILDTELSIGDTVEPSDPPNFGFTTSFIANGTDDVIFRFINVEIGNSVTLEPDPSQDFTVINGFTLTQIPEPTTLAVAGLAGLGLLAVRRRIS